MNFIVSIIIVLVSFIMAEITGAGSTSNTISSYDYEVDGGLVESKLEKCEITQGVMEQRGHMRHVSDVYASRLVREARKITKPKEHAWISVELLLGLAINETDLRYFLINGYDCGLTQNRVSIWEGTERGRRKLCKKLSKSSQLSLEYGVKELTNIKNRYCKHWVKRLEGCEGSCDKIKSKLSRCILNSYNQGPRYRRVENCKSKNCRIRSRYWLRVACFATGIKMGKKLKNCRAAQSIKWIARRFDIDEQEVVLF